MPEKKKKHTEINL